MSVQLPSIGQEDWGDDLNAAISTVEDLANQAQSDASAAQTSASAASASASAANTLANSAENRAIAAQDAASAAQATADSKAGTALGTESVAGLARIATDLEVTDGVADNRMVTPLRLAERLEQFPELDENGKIPKSTVPTDVDPNPNTVVERTINGNVRVAEPTLNNHATTKLFVDNAFTAAQAVGLAPLILAANHPIPTDTTSPNRTMIPDLQITAEDVAAEQLFMVTGRILFEATTVADADFQLTGPTGMTAFGAMHSGVAPAGETSLGAMSTPTLWGAVAVGNLAGSYGGLGIGNPASFTIDALCRLPANSPGVIGLKTGAKNTDATAGNVLANSWLYIRKVA